MTTRALKRALFVAVGAAAMLLSTVAQATGVPGQGTWETTLLGRDINGNAVDASSAAAVFLYDTTLNVTWLRDGNNSKTSGYSSDGSMAWNSANAWVIGLTVGAYSGWRLPTMLDPGANACIYSYSNAGGTDCGYNVRTKSGDPAKYEAGQTVYSEMAQLWYVELGNKAFYAPGTGIGPQPGYGLSNTGSFQNLLDDDYWSGLEAPPRGAWFFNAGSGGQGTIEKTTYKFHALAVRDGDVAAVPEPGTYVLMLAGLIGVGAARRRQRR